MKIAILGTGTVGQTLGGKLTVVRTTKEIALRRPAKPVELFDVQSIRLDREIANVHDQAAVTYRVRLTGDLPPDKVFAKDARQAIEKADGVHDEMKRGRLLADEVRPAMAAAREAADRLEQLVDQDSWALPRYREMLMVK